MWIERPEDIELYGRVDGVVDSRSRPPIVLTHDLFCDHQLFAALRSALVDANYRVVSWDVRGHGRSTGTAAPLEWSTLVGDALAVLRAAEVGRAVWLGVGLGAQLVARVAQGRPDAVAGVVLWSPPQEPTPEVQAQRARLLLRTAKVSSMRVALSSGLHRALWRRSKRGQAGLAALMARTAKTLQPAAMEPILELSMRGSFPVRVWECPTWVAWGEQDLDADPTRWLDALAEVHGEAVPDAGRLLHLDKPEWAQEQLLAWLSGLSFEDESASPL